MGLHEGGGDIAVLTRNGCPIIWGLLESRHCGVTTAHCCPTTDQDPRKSAVSCSCTLCVCLNLTSRSAYQYMHASFTSYLLIVDSTHRAPEIMVVVMVGCVCVCVFVYYVQGDRVCLMQHAEQVTPLWPSYTLSTVQAYLYSQTNLSVHFSRGGSSQQTPAKYWYMTECNLHLLYSIIKEGKW